MYFKKHLLLPLSVSLIALLTLSPVAEAMHSVGSDEDSASQHMGSVPSRHSVAPVSVASAAPAPEGRRAGRIRKNMMILPERTPVLKQRLFVPWRYEWDNLTLKNAQHLARDSLARLVDPTNLIHQDSLDVVRSYMESVGWSVYVWKESPAERFYQVRDDVRKNINHLPQEKAIQLARIFQSFWNRRVERSEDFAAEKQDSVLRSELLAAARAEFSNPELFPLWRPEERSFGLNMYETWSKPIGSKELMGRLLLERGRACMTHCLRHPTLGPRLLAEILAVQSQDHFEELMNFGFLEAMPALFQDPVFPEDALKVTPESETKVLKLLKQARTFSEVVALRNSIYGPALMSLEAVEMGLEYVSGEPLAMLARLLPNMHHLTWGWGSNVRMTSKVVEEGVMPLLHGRPETLTHITFRHDLPEELRARVQENTPAGVEVTWIADAAEIAPPSEAETQEDEAFFRSLLAQQMMNLFHDERLGSFDRRMWSFEMAGSCEEKTSASVGSYVMKDFLSSLEGPYLSGSHSMYGPLQALVREAESAGQDLGTLDLSSMRSALNAAAWHQYQRQQNTTLIPWYIVYGEDTGRPMDGPDYVPPIPLAGDADLENAPVDVSSFGLGEGLYDMYTRIRAQGAGPKPTEYEAKFLEGQLLKPVGLA